MSQNKPEWWDLARGVALLLTLVTSGAGLGYWYADTANAVLHQGEFDALRHDYKQALDVLAGRVGRTADQVAEVADVVANAAQTAHEAAGAADQATDSSSTKTVNPQHGLAITKADDRAINQVANAQCCCVFLLCQREMK